MKLRAERRAGELLALTVEHGGDRRSESRSPQPNLKDLGVTPDQSSEWQALAALPEAEFDRALEEARADGVVTRGGVVRRAMGVHYSSETDLWSTPQDLFDELDAEFGFTLDVCATVENAKCAAFFTAAQDGLAQEWTGVCWMNPPYGDEIGRWVAKAYESGRAGATVVCLVPLRLDTRWAWNYCRFGELRLLQGRLKFGGGETSAPFPSAVVVFPRQPKGVWWER